MQTTSLLEARRLTWQHCSTSKVLCTAHGFGHKPAVQHHLPSSPLLIRQQQKGLRRARLSTSQFRCQSQAQDTKERQAEETDGQNGYTNGSSSNGNNSNGKASTSNGNGSSSQQYETDSSQESLGAVSSKDGNGQVSKAKGTLDHLLESSRQVCKPSRNSTVAVQNRASSKCLTNDLLCPCVDLSPRLLATVHTVYPASFAIKNVFSGLGNHMEGQNLFILDVDCCFRLECPSGHISEQA